MKKKFPSLHLNADDFIPATNDEKESLVVMRDSVNFWADGMRRLRKNKIAMISLVFILIIMFFAYVMPAFWPYSYEQQIKYSENLKPFEYSQTEQARIDAGEKVFPHICGTDKLGRDFAVRLMMGTRISLTVGLICAALVLIVGSIFGAVAGFAGGWVDIIMMRITDILYTIPDVLLIIVLSLALKPRLEDLAEQPGFGWMNTVGPNLIAIFLVFVLLYWVGMARITRSQILVLKESEYVTAARSRRKQLAHNQKAPAHKLHRHPYRYHNSSDPLGYIHRELSELPRTRRCGSHAVARLPRNRCGQGHEHLSASAVFAGNTYQRHHSRIQPLRRRTARCV